MCHVLVALLPIGLAPAAMADKGYKWLDAAW